MLVACEPQNYPCGECACDENGRSPHDTWTIPGVLERSPVCPARLITERSRFFLELHRHYKNGVLPIAGGLLDQPYAYMRAMTIIEEWVARAEQSKR